MAQDGITRASTTGARPSPGPQKVVPAKGPSQTDATRRTPAPVGEEPRRDSRVKQTPESPASKMLHDYEAMRRTSWGLGAGAGTGAASAPPPVTAASNPPGEK